MRYRAEEVTEGNPVEGARGEGRHTETCVGGDMAEGPLSGWGSSVAGGVR